jgi:hypothetical protein
MGHANMATASASVAIARVEGKGVMSLEESVRKWLEDQGYPLEMKVAETLRASKLSWDHGRVYTDPFTDKVREIDVVGYLDRISTSPRFSIHLVFECKHTRGRPWILFCTQSPTLTVRGHVMSVPATKPAEPIMKALAGIEAVQSMRLFRRPDLIGFNLVRVHTDNQDTAFHAVRGVTTASLSLAAEIGKWRHYVLFPPVIVVDSPLLQCYLPAGKDDYVLREIKEGSLIYNPGGGCERTPIQVIHVDALQSFLETVKKESAELGRHIRQITDDEAPPGRT